MFRKLLFVVIALLMAAVPSVWAQDTAQEDDQETAVLVGVLDLASEGSIVVAGQTFDTTGAQMVSPLLVGALVEVEFYSADGVAFATEVYYADDYASALYGIVETLDAETLVINGITLNLAAAFVEEGVAPGATVYVRFILVNDTAYALEVWLDEADDDIEDPGEDDSYEVSLVGTLEAIDGTVITVDGLQIDISSAEIGGELETGILVVVEFVELDGVLTAVYVAPYTPQEYELYGPIEALDGSLLTVGGVTVDIASAEVVSDDGLAVGDEVEVGYYLLEGEAQAFYVEEIREEDASEDDDEDETEANTEDVSGTVEALTETSMTVAGVTLNIEIAVLESDDGLAVGDSVMVEYIALDGLLVALRITEDSMDDSEDDGSGDDDIEDPGEDGSDDDDDTLVCGVIPDGWVAYTIQAGDTLSEIAAAADAELEALLIVNCLSDPGSIVAGTTLYVPQMPEFGDDDGGDDDGGDDDGGDDDGGDDDGGDDDGGDDDGGDDDGGDDDGGDDDGGDDDGN